MAEPEEARSGRTIAFGSFRLTPGLHLLLDGDKRIPLGSRAVDILAALVDRPGEVVTKEELTAAAWPDTFVEESNLRVHIAGIRRALRDGQSGNRYVITVPGRGYRFVAPVSLAEELPELPPAPAPRLGNLPLPRTRMIGRSSLVSTLAAQLMQRRFLTLVGPGGIGKTTVAMAVAGDVAPAFRDGVAFVDLAPVADPHLVPSALSAVLGLESHSEDQIPGLIAFLKDKQALLVLDSCEHVIDIAAALAEEVFGGATDVHILATSREPLRAAGERIHRLAPLETPAAAEGLTAAAALAFPGVELFVERAGASLDGFVLSDAEAPIVAEICRRLDGIALAIELAARRVDAFGIGELAAHLDDRFRLLTSGRRTALPRHQTLAATLDWSYDLLPETEAAVLRRLAVFAGDFPLDAAVAVAGDLPAPLVVDHIANLVAKSLVAADLREEIARYRLLETTRLYALQKLRETGEIEGAIRRHAEHYHALFERAQTEWETEPTDTWLAEYGHHLGNVRVALDWAFAPRGDAQLGVRLTIAAVPLWTQLSLMNECRRRVEQALDHLGVTSDDTRLRMQLSTALCLSRMSSRDPPSEINAAWSVTLALAEEIGDAEYQLRAVWGLFAGNFNSGDFQAALRMAERFRDLTTDPIDRLIGERLIGMALHFLGDPKSARERTELMLAGYTTPVHGTHIIRFQNDQIVAARRVLAPVQWLLGFPDKAMRTVGDAIADAVAIDHAVTLCNFLAQCACPVAFLAGDLAAADAYVTMLIEQAARHSLDAWHAYGRCFQGMLLIEEGEFDRGLARLRDAGGQLRQAGFTQYETPYLCALAEGLLRAGRIELGVAAIDEGLARIESNNERWCLAEMLRVKGELVLAEGGSDADAKAEAHFVRSLDWARGQQALSWELRTATSLARLRCKQSRAADAHKLLSEVYNRFTEGFGTRDLRAASEMLVRFQRNDAASDARG